MSQEPPSHQRQDRIRLGELMAFVAGLAVAFWLYARPLREAWSGIRIGGAGSEPFFSRYDGFVWFMVVVVLGGLSVVGVPLLLRERLRKPPSAWRAGKQLWFMHGTAAWLMWPPIIAQRVANPNSRGDSISEICYFYGTPLMAVYVVITLWTGGSLRRSRRKRLKHSWRERFGLVLGLAWACTGLYLFAMYYRMDFFRR